MHRIQGATSVLQYFFFPCGLNLARVVRTSATGKESSQTLMCEHCDGYLMARSSKLNEAGCPWLIRLCLPDRGKIPY